MSSIFRLPDPVSTPPAAPSSVGPLSSVEDLVAPLLALQHEIAKPDPATSLCDTLAQARRRSALLAELETLLAALGASLVDALLAGQQVAFLEKLAAIAPASQEVPLAPPRDPALVSDEQAAEADAIAQLAAPPARKETAEASVVAAECVADPAPSPEPVEITEDVALSLQEKLRQNSMGQESDRVDRNNRLRDYHRRSVSEMVRSLGPTPPSLANVEAIRQEVERLAGIGPAQTKHWAEMGREADHALTSWVAARARAAQDAARRLGVEDVIPRLNRVFPMLSRHTKETMPGVVHGLARAHTPQGQNWLADARRHELRLRKFVPEEGRPTLSASAPNHDDELRKLTEDCRAGLDAQDFCRRAVALLSAGLSPKDKRLINLGRPFLPELTDEAMSPLRRAIEGELAEEIGAEEDKASPLPEGWRLLAQTRGKRCVLVGGEPRQEQRSRLEEVFEFASLEWLANPKEGLRRVDDLVGKMKSGSVDLVIVLRAFISHKVSDKLFAVKSPLCRVIQAETYSTTRVRLGLERFLDAKHA